MPFLSSGTGIGPKERLGNDLARSGARSGQDCEQDAPKSERDQDQDQKSYPARESVFSMKVSSRWNPEYFGHLGTLQRMTLS
jgi:hypothetical protein